MSLFVFCVCAAVIFYVYFGYPLLLAIPTFAGRALGDRQVREPDAPEAAGTQPLPTVSVIIPAHNEGSSIEAKLANILASQYPRNLLEILVGSDGSRDATERIATTYGVQGVKLVSLPRQQGKSAMQNSLVAASSGSILIFTDADCLVASDALRCLVAHFSDSGVGLVTAHPTFSNTTATSVTVNESMYLRYDNWLRRRESDAGTLAMASGSLFAMRRSLWLPLDPRLGDDFVLPLCVAAGGMRNVLDPGIFVTTRLSQDRATSLFRAKVRIVSKDLRALLAHRAVLNPFRRPALAASLWSHKLLRWLIPYFLIGLFASNAILAVAAHPVARTVLLLQLAFYALALAGLVAGRRAFRFPWSVSASFCVVNSAALVGTLKCFFGRTSALWTPERAARATPHEPESFPAASSARQ